MLAAVCVLAAAAATAAEPAKHDGARADLTGRWQGPKYRMAALAEECTGKTCQLTLDISPCGEGWCGVEVAHDLTCRGTAMTVDAGETNEFSTRFKGRLELAKGTEPYVIEAYLIPAAGEVAEMLEIQGDTGGEFRAFRRSFPFGAQHARAGESHCRADKPVS
jgi:hypothetical protein